MTEEEARKTICPKYKAAVLTIPNFYLPSEINKMDEIKCDASDCQLWKWSEPEIEITYDRPTPCCEEDGWSKNNISPATIEYSRIKPDRHGFCGLGDNHV